MTSDFAFIAEDGFYSGLEVGRQGLMPLPPNPHPLRSQERGVWFDGWVIGRRLGWSQREEAKRAFAAEFPEHRPRQEAAP